MKIIKQRQREFVFLLSAFIILLLPWQVDASAADKDAFSIDDYFEVKRITELAFSSEGEWIAYRTVQQSLEHNQAEQKIFIMRMEEGAKPVYVDSIQSGQSFSWIPGTQKLAFLSTNFGTVQVQSLDIKTKKITQHTNSKQSISAFKFSPDGKILAFLTKGPEDGRPVTENISNSLHDQLYNGETGVVMDADGYSLYNFTNPSMSITNIDDVKSDTTLWIKPNEGDATHIPVHGAVRQIHWSYDSRRISVQFLDSKLPANLAAFDFTSIGTYELETQMFKVIASAQYDANDNSGEYFTGGEWIPDNQLIHIRRINQDNVFSKYAEWSLVDTSENGRSLNHSYEWAPIEHGSSDRFYAVNKDEIYLNKTVRAETALYMLAPDNLIRSQHIKNIDGAAKYFRFSADFQTAVFVNENLTKPPEIYVWQAGAKARRLTQINTAIAKKKLPHAREVSWQSKDGVTIHGWLLLPPGQASVSYSHPLVTYVHGGPGFPYNNEFAYGFFGYGGFWPYPFEVYAMNGIAVFLPNYRGTKSYGPEIGIPSEIDGEPVDDIVSGIKHLIYEGVADAKKLAISGHSHGGWLAPLVMTRHRIFRAASFADGTANMFVGYAMMPGLVNRFTHDQVFFEGDDLYSSVERAVEVSPVFHFQGLETAVLFEAGVESLAVAMLDHVKAARLAGMPTEYIVYPKTFHSLRIPTLQKESAERNLDWLMFWLNDAEDPNPVKQDQYMRWRAMPNSSFVEKNK